MRIAVVGAGIVGVTTAYELVRSGHEVTVFERRPGVATEASFANAGVVAPGYVTPWAAPGMPLKVLGQLFRRDAAVRFAGLSALGQWRWMWRWLRACKAERYAKNRAAMQRLAHYSRGRLIELTRSLRLEYEQQSGYLVLLRGAADLERARPGLALLKELGVAHEVIDAARCRTVEPALSEAVALHAGIHLAQDGLGNCRQFAHLLKGAAQREGADFRFDSPVSRIEPGAAPVVVGHGDRREAFDRIVLAAGVESHALLAPQGVRLPLAPVYGYSITAPLRHHDGGPEVGPRAAVMDERYKVAISRLGQRVRVAGIAELGGHVGTLRPAPLGTLYRVLDDWFPGAASPREAQSWKGARPMLPDGPPVLGKCPLENVWLNLGHGSSGWALACGSARLLADALSGQAPEIDTEGLGFGRLRV